MGNQITIMFIKGIFPTLSNFQHDENMWKADDDGDIDDVVLITWIFLFKTGEELFGQSKLASVFG